MFDKWGKQPEEAPAAATETTDDHRFYAGVALKAMIDRWNGDPEKARHVIAHKAHLLADAMANADWKREEPTHG